MFEDDLNDIKEQLDSAKDSTSKDLEEKLDLLIEMLRTRIDSLR